MFVSLIPGIDFGTTHSKAAYLGPGGEPVGVLNDRGEASTPSAVFVSPNGDTMIGTPAIEQGFLEPERLVRNFKLELGSDTNLLGVTDQVFTAQDAAAALIAYLKKQVENATGSALTECVATCPANFKDDQKQALLEAFEANGITVLSLMPEPTAAGYAYALARPGTDQQLQVCDIGGGTTDASIIQARPDDIAVLATHGIPRLGGNDINSVLSAELLERFEKKTGTKPDPHSNGLFALDLSQRVETTKISLGHRDKVPVVISYDGKQEVIEITRDSFGDLIEPFTRQVLQAIDEALKAANTDADGISHLLMVGGSCRLPQIQEAVAQHTGLRPRTEIDPEQAIAYGAALACGAEMKAQGRSAMLHGQVIPTSDVLARNVTAHHVGCCVVDVAHPSRRLSHAVIIPKNTPIPCRRIDRFYLEHESQTEAHIEILQGDPDADRDRCLLIGEVTLADLPAEDKASARIQVEYAIDKSGMVTATVADTVSAKSETVSVDYKKGVKPREKPTAA